MNATLFNTKTDVATLTKNDLQANFATKALYKGKNQIELITAKKRNNYQSNYWLTFVQARELGLKIIKGSKGFGIFNGYRDEDGEKVFCGYSTVFNLDQTEKTEKTGR